MSESGRAEGPSVSPVTTGGSWTQVGVFGAGVVLEQLRSCLLVRPARPTPAQAEAGRQLQAFAEAAAPAGSATTSVLVVYIAPFTGISLSGLLTVLREPLNRLREGIGYQQIQIVTGRAEHSSAHGPSPFQVLSDALRTPVLAPVGTLLQVPGNTLFPVDGAGAGTWQRFAPGRSEPVLVGPWHLTALWASSLPLAPTVFGETEVDVLPVPAGVVLLANDGRTGTADDITYSLPIDPQHPLIVVDRLGGDGLAADQVAGYLRTIPDRTRHTARVCSAAAAPGPDWGRAVADALGEPVEVLTGLPLLRAGVYTPCVLHTDDSGGIEVLWEPFVSRLRYAPNAPVRPAQITGWRSPGDDLDQTEDRVYRLDPDWVVEVLASGLWLRRAVNRTRDAAADRPFDPAEPTLLVGSPGDDLDDQVWSYVGDLSDRIVRATGARGRIQVLAAASGPAPAAQLLTARTDAPPGPPTTDLAEPDPADPLPSRHSATSDPRSRSRTTGTDDAGGASTPSARPGRPRPQR